MKYISIKHICIIVAIVAVVLLGLHFQKKAYDSGYKAGYDVGYSEGYKNANAFKEKEIADAVAQNTKTETKIVYQKIPYNGNDVQIKTEKPVVTVEVNGKKQQIQQHSETADLAVKTETAVKIRIPERRWKLGVGTDGHSAAGMLSFPIKGAVGGWVAGSKGKVMGGLSISF